MFTIQQLKISIPFIFIIQTNFSSFSRTKKYINTGRSKDRERGYKLPPAKLIIDDIVDYELSFKLGKY